jgi:hypothetical protein
MFLNGLTTNNANHKREERGSPGEALPRPPWPECRRISRQAGVVLSLTAGRPAYRGILMGQGAEKGEARTSEGKRLAPHWPLCIKRAAHQILALLGREAGSVPARHLIHLSISSGPPTS